MYRRQCHLEESWYQTPAYRADFEVVDDDFDAVADDGGVVYVNDLCYDGDNYHHLLQPD